jgi:hypothetical protein
MAKPETPDLSTADIDRLVLALRSWAERHPAADEPLLSFAGAEVLTPRQLADEVEGRTTNGLAFIRMVHFGTEVMPFEEIIARFGELKAAV